MVIMDFKQKILIVEDDMITACLIMTILERMGHHVYEPVSTGESAIEIAVLNKPDLILMDIWLAGVLNGYDAAEKILSLCDTSIVFISGHSESDLIFQSGRVNYLAFLKKPLDGNELEEVVRRNRS